MFEAAKAEKQDDQSELVPFWCFGKDQSVKDREARANVSDE